MTQGPEGAAGVVESAHAQGAPKMAASVRRRLLVAFFVGWVFMYADRAVLSPVLAAIGDEFAVGPARLGLLTTVFFLAYTVLQVPFGLAAESVGRKRMLVGGFVLFGVTTLASGLAPTYLVLLALGALTGVGQATYYPAQYSLAAEAQPGRDRTFSFAIINSGMAVGVGGGTAFAAFLAFGLDLGWRVSLVVMGALTVLVAAGMGRIVIEPPRHEQAARPRVRISVVLRRRQVAAYVAAFCSLYGFFVVLVWLPFYLVEFRGMGGLSGGLLATIAAWTSIPAALVMARWSDRTGERRRLLYGVMVVGAVSFLLLPHATTPWSVVAVLALYGTAGKLTADPLLIAYLADWTEPHEYAAAYGVFNFSGMLASVAAPFATGLIVDVTGTMTATFWVAAALLLVGAVALAVLGEDHPTARRHGHRTNRGRRSTAGLGGKSGEGHLLDEDAEHSRVEES